MYWYALEPLAGAEPERALQLALKPGLGYVLPFVVRRIASSGTPENLELLVAAMDKAPFGPNGVYGQTILLGLEEALRGQRDVLMPKSWPAVFAKLTGRQAPDFARTPALTVAVIFGDAKSLRILRDVALKTDAAVDLRQQALTALLTARDKQLGPALHQLLDDKAMRGSALRGLAATGEPQAPQWILEVYPKLSLAEKRDALNTLASRKDFAKALLAAVGAKKIAATDVTADLVRQLRTLKSPELEKQIVQVWGIVRDTPAEKAKLMKHYRALVLGPGLPPDPALGRAVFTRTCQQCHILFGVGGKVGPDITGANRANLDYLLENILDPSAVIPKEYAVTIIELENGRFINAIIKEQTAAAVTAVTANETLILPRGDIRSMQPTTQSMMPDDQLKPMSDHEVRSLIAYLQSPVQVPILATAETAKEFFNGKDLTGWDGDPKLWKVENGEIVGRGPDRPVPPQRQFLRSHLMAESFRLSFQVKMTPDKGEGGVQFRSAMIPPGDMKGLKAGIGARWWGMIFDARGRGLLTRSGAQNSKPAEWNVYVIEAIGPRVRMWLNGKLCADLSDPPTTAERSGVFALECRWSGSLRTPAEVRFKDLRLEINPQPRP
jgi:putative heme-binding domain-containing protein